MAPGQFDSESATPLQHMGVTTAEMSTWEPHARTSKSTDGSEPRVNQPGFQTNNAQDEETATMELLDLATRDETEEVFLEVERKAQRSQYSTLGRAIFEKEKERGELSTRSRQAVLHITFTEMRILQLEEEFRKFKAELGDISDDFKLSSRQKKCPVCKPVLKRSVLDEFQTTPYSKDIPIQQRPALEVLFTHRIPQLGSKEEHQKLPQRSTGFLERDQEHLTTHHSPERLRIRSLPLIAHLEKICRENLSNNRVWVLEDISQLQMNHERAPVVLLRPFKLLVNYEQEIRESVQELEALLCSTTGVNEANEVKKGSIRSMEFEYGDLLTELKLLIEFIDVDLKPTFDLRHGIRNGTATDIEYVDLWHLFELGDIVIAQSKKEQALRVVNFTGGRDKLIHMNDTERKRKAPPVVGFTVDCCSLCYDGNDYVPKLEKFSIRKFSGRRPITSLEVYPLKLDENSDVILQEFVSQGRRYLELTRSPFSHRMFKGRTLNEPPQELEAQVIVDIALAVNTKPEWRPKGRVMEEDFTQSDTRETQSPPFCKHFRGEEGCCGSDYIFKDLEMNHSSFNHFRRDYGGILGPRSAHEIEEEDIILLPNWVYGFVLRSRQWVALKTANLSEVQFENDFDELMLPESHKRTILALVGTHENTRTTSPKVASTVGAALDLVNGKGTGLIILLHGEPGVGKTSTAECVADKKKRPLFPITCGDIGETGVEVERNLHHNFHLAHKWGCVLLLDEADVFLAKRNKIDLRRNAVTSIFLRSLEYYAGILFLTTNRVGGIDPAFKSRLHLSVYYPRIDLHTTLKLYEVYLKRAKAEQLRSGITLFKIRDKEILRFGKQHYNRLKKEGFNTWNGRQIRNAVQTAIALVEHEAAENGIDQPKPILGKAQFEIVAQGSKEFDGYLMKTLQGADDEIAIRDQWRHDRFDAGMKTSSLVSKPASKISGSLNAMISDGHDSEETESEDEDDGDDSAIEAESKVGASGMAGNTRMKGHAYNSIDRKEYEEFLRYKTMLKGKGKKT